MPIDDFAILRELTNIGELFVSHFWQREKPVPHDDHLIAKFETVLLDSRQLLNDAPRPSKMVQFVTTCEALLKNGFVRCLEACQSLMEGGICNCGRAHAEQRLLALLAEMKKHEPYRSI